ncbi:MAG: S1C family serine protease [Luteolibacter sp.]
MTFRIAITPSLAVLLASPVIAIEAPPDDAPPPPELAPAGEAAGPQEDPAPARAYLGVVAEQVPEMLAAHLGLDAGSGIIVRAVMPDSPAAKAGLEVHDVITRFAGDPVACADDLTTAIQGCKPGEAVHLDLIRRGEQQKLDATLGNRPADLAGPAVRPLDQLNLDGIADPFAERVRRMLEGKPGEPMPGFGQGIHDIPADIDQAMRDLQDRMRQMVEEMPDHPEAGRIRMNHGTTFRLMDEEGSIEIKSIEGGKEVTVRDPQGSITWSGPWDTEQDKAGAPEDVRRRVERLNLEDHANGLRLKFRQGGIGAGGP